MIKKVCVKGTPLTVEKISPLVGLELGTTRSVGQHLTTELQGLLIFKESNCNSHLLCNTYLFFQILISIKKHSECAVSTDPGLLLAVKFLVHLFFIATSKNPVRRVLTRYGIIRRELFSK